MPFQDTYLGAEGYGLITSATAVLLNSFSDDQVVLKCGGKLLKVWALSFALERKSDSHVWIVLAVFFFRNKEPVCLVDSSHSTPYCD